VGRRQRASAAITWFSKSAERIPTNIFATFATVTGVSMLSPPKMEARLIPNCRRECGSNPTRAVQNQGRPGCRESGSRASEL
jgi:hypothetical protein